MRDELPELIGQWFVSHSDAEFVQLPYYVPYSVIFPRSGTGQFIYSTKPAVASRALDRLPAIRHLGLIGRYGLPSGSEVNWIRELIGEYPLLFIGDADPVDLMIFAWLR